MTLTSGARLGPYEVVALLGAGGMGEVYRARDTRLDRPVAIKVLSAAARNDRALRERLEREARSISQLQHPNVCTLFDVGHESGTDFLVMELLEGETLADRLRRGPLPVAEALSVAIKIAAAVERAHSRGIVHRDLKPGNVMLTPDGPKVLDFGLAKDIVAGRAPGTDSATPTSLMTSEGTIVGTLQYMAPEQLEGKPVDERSDVFAFGSVLFEMLTGSRPFESNTQASVIAAIMERPAPRLESRLESLRAAAPPGLDRVVERCLAKSPGHRWQSMGDVRALLEDVAAGRLAPTAAEQAVEPPERPARLRLFAVAAVLALPVAIAAAWIVGRSTAPAVVPAPQPVVVSVLSAPELGGFDDLSNPALSPDGRRVAFIGHTSKGSGIWVRELDSLEAQPLEGPVNPGWLTFSPDGEWIAYFDVSDRTLMKVSVHGGRPTPVANPGYIPCDWAADGYIYFPARRGPGATSPESCGLARIRPDGGEAEQVTLGLEVDKAGVRLQHTAPQYLGDGRLLFSVGQGFLSNGWDTAVLDLASGKWTRVFRGADQASYHDGHLVFWRDGRVWAVPLDLDRLATTGTELPVTDGVSQHPSAPLEVGEYQVGADGSMVYVGGGAVADETSAIVRYSAGGQTEIARSPGMVGWPRLSPRGDRLAVDVCRLQPLGGRQCRVWVYGLHDGSRRAIGPADKWVAYPAWDADGASLVVSERTPQNHRQLVRYSLTPGVSPKPLFTKEQGWIVAIGAASDGRLVFSGDDEDGRVRVRIVSPTGESVPLLDDDSDAFATDISSDGRWLIFDTDRSGRFEICALDLETPGSTPVQLTTEGGRFGTLSPSGKVLYWRSPSYPGAAQILRAEVDLERGRRGDVTRVATTASVNSGGWYPLGGMTAGDDGLIVTEFKVASSGGRVILVSNWVADMRAKLARD